MAMSLDRSTACSTPASGAASVAVVLVAVGLALLAMAPSPSESLRTLRGLTAVADPLDPTAPVVALLGLVAWALTAYLALGAGLVLLGRAPGLPGQLASAVARRTVPVPVRRTVETLLGAGLALGTLGAVPATAATPQVTAPAESAAAESAAADTAATVSFDWPVTHPADPTAPPVEAPLPTPTATPAPTGALPAAQTPATTGASHVVRPGDTLWDLAAEALRTHDSPRPSDAAVATAWPSWWEANRDAIGDDPHLLHPGTALVAPPPPP